MVGKRKEGRDVEFGKAGTIEQTHTVLGSHHSLLCTDTDYFPLSVAGDLTQLKLV